MDAKELLAACNSITNTQDGMDSLIVGNPYHASARTLAAWVRGHLETLPGELDAVVDGLFRDGLGRDVKRLVLMNDDGKDRGGWCKESVKDRFHTLLAALGMEVRT